MQSLKNLSRRQLLKVSGSALLASSIWPGALRADDSTGENFGFLVVNDLHFFDSKCVPFFEKVVASMAATKEPMDFCIIVGDLSESGSPEQISTVRDLFKTLNKPLNLRSVFGGHYHAFTERKMGEVTLTTNRCCSFHVKNHDGTKEKGYFVCQAKDGKVERNFVEVPV